MRRSSKLKACAIPPATSPLCARSRRARGSSRPAPGASSGHPRLAPSQRAVHTNQPPPSITATPATAFTASSALSEQILARDLVAALEAVGRGESLLDPAVTEKVLERVRRIPTGAAADDLAALTTQEQKILLLVAEGKTNKEIAAEVFLSDKTVKNYVSSILSKLNLERRAQAAAYMAKLRGTGTGS